MGVLQSKQTHLFPKEEVRNKLFINLIFKGIEHYHNILKFWLKIFSITCANISILKKSILHILLFIHLLSQKGHPFNKRCKFVQSCIHNLCVDAQTYQQTAFIDYKLTLALVSSFNVSIVSMVRFILHYISNTILNLLSM